MSAPWNGAVVTYTANTSVTFTGEPRGRPPSWDYGVASPPRWYTWDGNGGGTFLPKTFPNPNMWPSNKRRLVQISVPGP